MLFTQATEVGIQLENALILSPENLAKSQITANNERILNWAKDNHVLIKFDSNPKSDFNCIIGIMMDERVSDSTMSTNKKMLKHLGDELIKFIDNLSDETDEAIKDAENHQKVADLIKQFKADVKSIYGEDTIVDICICKKSDLDSLISDILRQAIIENCQPMTAMVNQLHPPRKKNKEGVQLNVRKRIYYKSGNSSMLLCKDATIPASKVLISSIRDNMKKLGLKLEGNFIITN